MAFGDLKRNGILSPASVNGTPSHTTASKETYVLNIIKTSPTLIEPIRCSLCHKPVGIWYDHVMGVLRYTAPEVTYIKSGKENYLSDEPPKKQRRIKLAAIHYEKPCIWFSLSYSEYRRIHPAIEVRRSPLHGFGVFVKEGMSIKPQTWLAWYPGKKKLNDTSKFYEYGMGVGRYVWDASGVDNPDGKGNAIGHLVNSCHPMLPPPYNLSNAVYICVNVVSRKGGSKTVRAGVYAEHALEANQEILTDYHWFLDGIVHSPENGIRTSVQLRCDCEECIDLRRIRRIR